MGTIDSKYYQLSLNRKHSAKTEKAVAFDRTGLKVAVDCGCGAGVDINYLLEQGYSVNAFDSSSEAISICQEKFGINQSVNAQLNTFLDYSYPQCSLAIAHSSLYFIERSDLDLIWRKITNCIELGGVFCGDFLGFKDDWATGFRLPTCPLSEPEVKGLFNSEFKILSIREKNDPGDTTVGKKKHWHTFTVFAEKTQYNTLQTDSLCI